MEQYRQETAADDETSDPVKDEIEMQHSDQQLDLPFQRSTTARYHNKNKIKQDIKNMSPSLNPNCQKRPHIEKAKFFLHQEQVPSYYNGLLKRTDSSFDRTKEIRSHSNKNKPQRYKDLAVSSATIREEPIEEVEGYE